MKTQIDAVRERFTGTDSAGGGVNILAYHPGQEYPIIGERWGERRGQHMWLPCSYTDDGEITSGASSPFDLIKKRPVLPKDILCEVWGDSGKKICKRYSTGDGLFYNKGATSLTYEVGRFKWDNLRVIENPPQPWFGGECPIPEGCKFRVRVNGRWLDGANHIWVWSIIDYTRANITAYQILGGVGDD